MEQSKKRSFWKKLRSKDTYLAYYLGKRGMLISLLLSVFFMLNIIALFFPANELFTFVDIFLYFGILMILICGGTLSFIYFEGSYLWAIMGSLVEGVVPFIVLLNYIVNNDLNSTAHGLAVFSVVLSVVAIFLPFVLVAVSIHKRSNQNED